MPGSCIAIPGERSPGPNGIINEYSDMWDIVEKIITASTPLILGLAGIALTKKLSKVDSKVTKVDEKVDEYHKEVNSKLTTMLDTREELGKQKEKADNLQKEKGNNEK